MSHVEQILSIIKKARFNMISARLGVLFSGTILLIFLIGLFSREWDLDQQRNGIEAIQKSFPNTSFAAKSDSTTFTLQKMANRSALLNSLDTILSTRAEQNAAFDTAYSCSKPVLSIFLVFLYRWLYLKLSRRRPKPGSKKQKTARLPYIPFTVAVRSGLNMTACSLLLFTIITCCKWYGRQERDEKIATLKRQFSPDWSGMMKKDSAKYYIRKMHNEEEVFNKIDTEPLLTTDVRPLYAAEWTATCYALLLLGLFLGLSTLWQATYKVFLQ